MTRAPAVFVEPATAMGGGRKRRGKKGRRRRGKGLLRHRRRSGSGISRPRLKVMLPLLQSLYHANPDHRAVILAHLDSEARRLLYDAVGCALDPAQVPHAGRLHLREVLRPHKNNLRYLVRTTVPDHLKKRRLIRFGGSGDGKPLAVILENVLPVLVSEFEKKGRRRAAASRERERERERVE